MPILSAFPGEFAALGAALIWAIASFLFVALGKQMPPLILNLTKSSLAVGLILLTLVAIGDGSPNLERWPFLVLLVSGAIGIGCGDTAFFASLNRLGARRAILLESLSPPLAALLAALGLGEQLSWQAYLGIGLTVSGVAWVVVERTPEAEDPETSGARSAKPVHWWTIQGIGFGLVAALSQASGAVLSRSALLDSEVSPLWSTLSRLLGGIAVLVVLVAMRRSLWSGFRPLASGRFLAILTATAFAGTYLGILLQQVALKYTAAGIAQSLTATSPLFVIPIAMATGESVSGRSILGVLVAIGGIWLLFGVA